MCAVRMCDSEQQHIALATHQRTQSNIEIGLSSVFLRARATTSVSLDGRLKANILELSYALNPKHPLCIRYVCSMHVLLSFRCHIFQMFLFLMLLFCPHRRGLRGMNYLCCTRLVAKKLFSKKEPRERVNIGIDVRAPSITENYIHIESSSPT